MYAITFAFLAHLQQPIWANYKLGNRVCVCLLTKVSQIVTAGHGDVSLRPDTLTHTDHKAKIGHPDLLKPTERHCPWTQVSRAAVVG